MNNASRLCASHLVMIMMLAAATNLQASTINYQLYIDGVKELRELNMEANCGFEVAHPEERKSGCNLI